MKYHWAGLIAACLLMAMPATPALAQYQVQPPLEYYDNSFFNYGSRLCLQPEREARINGLAILQQPCVDNDPYQRWFFIGLRVEYQKPGIYLVVNSGSDQCLDDRDGRTPDGSPVQQWTCNFTSTTMQWKLESLGYDRELPSYPPRAQFINMRSGKCLDVRGGSSAPGARLQIYHCTSTGAVPAHANLAQVFEWADKMLRPEPAVKPSAR
jgi:Ricin-type beta-trefoil lectin domain-like